MSRFHATQEDYISYLEQKVQHLTEHHSYGHPSCPWSSDGHHVCSADKQQEKEGNRFSVLMWKPTSNVPTRMPAWKLAAGKLINRTPEARSWQQMADALHLDDLIQDATAAHSMSGSSLPGFQRGETLRLRLGGPLDLLQTYAWTAVLHEKAATSVITRINFQKFIVLCACAVLHKLDHPMEDLIAVTRICVGDVSSKYATSLWRTAVVLNKMIDMLRSNGWGDRASQLLLIWNEAPAFYYPFSNSPQAVLDMMKVKLSSKRYVSGVQSSERRPTLSVPHVVHRVLGSNYDLTQINKILGCQHSQTSSEESSTSEMGHLDRPPLQQAMNHRTANDKLFPGANRNGMQTYSLPTQVLEDLLLNVKVYFETSCRELTLDDHGNPLDVNGTILPNHICNEFDSYCFTATMFMERQLYGEFRHALSKACTLVAPILRAEHPRALPSFLEVFIHLEQTGLSEVSRHLCHFVRRMSAEVTKKGHPWAEIYRLLGELDSETFCQSMAQIWKCITDIFVRRLPQLSRFAVSTRLDYIKRVHGFTDYVEEERMLRGVFAQFDGNLTASKPRVMLNLAHNLAKQRLDGEAEAMALEVHSLLDGHSMYADRVSERIECLKIISHSQFNQGKAAAAEQTMWEALQMIERNWGKQHSWFLEFMNVLQKWFQDWGRQEADMLQQEIRGLLHQL